MRNQYASFLLTGALALLGACSDAPDPQAQAQALLEVAERGDVPALRQLLGESADVDVRNACDWTPLMEAAVKGHRDAVAELLAAGAEVDATDNGGYTALMLAASNDHAETVELLLAQGAMIDAQEQTQGYTALIWAAHRGHRRTVETLLRHGADTTLPDLKGRTAAEHARAKGREALAALIEGGGAGAAPSTAVLGG